MDGRKVTEEQSQRVSGAPAVSDRLLKLLEFSTELLHL